MRSAVIENNSKLVTNLIIADPSTDTPPEGSTLIRVGVSPVGVGWSYDNGGFSYTQIVTPDDLTASIAAEDASTGQQGA